MSNIQITNVDLDNPILKSGEFDNGTIVFAGADTLAAGTILARDTTNNNFVPFDDAGANGANDPKFVLPYAVTTDAPATVAVRVATSGVVRRNKLVIDNGDPVTPAILDQLKSNGIVSVAVDELNIPDNQ